MSLGRGTQWLLLLVWAAGLVSFFSQILIPPMGHHRIDPFAGKTPEQLCEIARQIIDAPDSSPGDREYMISHLDHVRSDEATDILRKAAFTQPPPVNKVAAAELFGRDDVTALRVLKDDLLKSSRFESGLSPMTTKIPADGSVRVMGTDITINLGVHLSSIRDPQAIPTLIQLMNASDNQTREGAAGALREILTFKEKGNKRWAPTWPTSVNVNAVTDAMVAGLDDSDEMVRYYSVCALMEINGNPNYPSVDFFQSNENAYVGGWKTWAKQRKATGP